MNRTSSRSSGSCCWLKVLRVQAMVCKKQRLCCATLQAIICFSKGNGTYDGSTRSVPPHPHISLDCPYSSSAYCGQITFCLGISQLQSIFWWSIEKEWSYHFTSELQNSLRFKVLDIKILLGNVANNKEVCFDYRSASTPSLLSHCFHLYESWAASLPSSKLSLNESQTIPTKQPITPTSIKVASNHWSPAHVGSACYLRTTAHSWSSESNPGLHKPLRINPSFLVRASSIFQVSFLLSCSYWTI